MITFIENWMIAVPKLTRTQKAKLTRARKKHYLTLKTIRAKVIERCFPEHIGHGHVSSDTLYEDGVFQYQHLWCGCDLILRITKTMFEDEYGKEYRDLSAA